MNSDKCSDSAISGQEWYAYYFSLSQAPDKVHTDLENILKELEQKHMFNELDNKITIKEMFKAIS